MMPHCAPKTGLFQNGFHSGIDQQGKFLRLFDPFRYQTPAYQTQNPPCLFLADRRDGLGWRDIVSRRKVFRDAVF